MTSDGAGRRATIGVRRIDAITLATHDMGRALAFYKLLDGELLYGAPDSTFATFRLGGMHLNLVLEPPELEWSFWGRIVFHVDDVDAAYQRCIEAGFTPEGEPRDAEWGERYFHVLDPDGHQLSFARPIEPDAKAAGGHALRNEVDEASAESFPASDAPTFTPTTGPKQTPAG